MPGPEKTKSGENRRNFLKTTTAAAVGSSLLTLPGLQSAVYADSSDILKVGLVGCGGRGTGAARQALKADAGARLVAMADTFSDRIESSLTNLGTFKEVTEQIQVPAENKFDGFEGYKNVVDMCDVVLLATPPHFRPEHIKYAVEKDKHIFAEKPVAVDAPGCRSVMESCRIAKEKGLAVVSGLCWRYHEGMRETFKRIHDGMIGDIVSMRASYNTRGLWSHERQPEWSDMEYQVRNWLYYNWLAGDHINEQHIHSIDKMAWAMQDIAPLSATGTGGRQTRTQEIYGNVYDHFAIEFVYDNDVRGYSRCRQQDGCHVDVDDQIVGTKGKVDTMRHEIKDHTGKRLWRFKGKSGNMYDVEHEELFASIRSGNPINNGEYMTKSTMMAILGRMSAYTGQEITWDQGWNSEEDLTPPAYDWTSLAVAPVPMPGVTPFV
ncbi:Putative 4,5-dihydroxyphthalate dehydrogenase [Polystyrenella longa]|uniref:4,5-dihydroxyphthalate dehydrogenase n=1 Tax=Polystyrenella longa TaxID=2528007 RepID=A0A518CRH5_9PLAN|nr:Gfo/Idh/MocA family oxidoreductase [Polystyrenella longa]QDU81818.1 Putative 4,5-dihydroxyphthalate dehydrogenase [Polystyrenella longa]